MKAQTLTLLRGLPGAVPASLSIEPGLARLCRTSGVARTISNQVGDSGTVGAGANPNFCVKSRPLGEENVVSSAGEAAIPAIAPGRAGVAKAPGRYP